jgi:hypothetical protein
MKIVIFSNSLDKSVKFSRLTETDFALESESILRRTSSAYSNLSRSNTSL